VSNCTIAAPPVQRDHRRPRPTGRQLACLKAVARFHADNGTPPSLRDLGRLLGDIHTTGVLGHVAALRRKGLLTVTVGRARSFRPTATGLLVLDGWHFGPSPLVTPETLAIDAEAAGRMRCGGCKRRGLTFVVMHRGDSHGGVAACPHCRSWTEEV
jgi:hypothetical protein